MSTLGIIAFVSVAIWMLILSIAVLLIIRQLGIVTLQLERASNSAYTFLENDGPHIGSEVSDEVLSVLSASSACLMFVSATCGTCRTLIADMYSSYATNVTIMLTGNDELADGLASLIPEGIPVIRDPLAHQVASSLQIQSTPFAVVVSDGQIQNKSYLFSHQTLIQLTQNRIPLELA